MTNFIFKVGNHHSTDDEKTPQIDGDQAHRYDGYFENEHREQFVFVYDYSTNEGKLWVGDADREAFPVVDGKVNHLVMAESEAAWLKVCWNCAMFTANQ